jgi:hypothetical protein
MRHPGAVVLLACLSLHPIEADQAPVQPPIPPTQGRDRTPALSSKADPATASRRRTWTRVRIPDPHVSTIVRTVLDDVWRVMGEPRCQTLLEEFRDRHARPLSDRLARMGLDVQRYLEFVFFEDGSQHTQCGSTVAYARPGARVIYLCVRTFEREWRQNGQILVAKVIHEVLHTLGLGENPPPSSEITARVRKRCGGQ